MSDSTSNSAVESIKATIPDKFLNQFKEWKVKQVVITKAANSNNPLKVLGVNIRDPTTTTTTTTTATNQPQTRKLSRMGTSKLHKFHPAVSLNEGLNWLVEYRASDASLLFENNCSALFQDGHFTDFEDIRDEEEEEEEGEEDKEEEDQKKEQQRIGQQQQQQFDEEAEEEEEEPPVDHHSSRVEGERFQVGHRDHR